MTDNDKKIIVRAPNWIGDAVLAAPFLNALPKVFPDSDISIAGKSHIIELLNNFPRIEEYIVVDEKEQSGSFLSFTRYLKNKRYDLGFLLTNSFRTAFQFYLGKVKKRTGYALELRRLFLTHPISAQGEIMEKSMVDYYMNLLSPFTDISKLEKNMSLHTSDSDEKRAIEILKESGWDGISRLVGINPFSYQWVTKRWFPERFAKVTDRLTDNYGVQCAFAGSDKDRRLFEKIKSLCSNKIIDLVGKTPLSVLPSVMKHYSLFITNDSGLMHVAAAMNVPIVAIFGPTDYRRTAPYTDKATLLRYETDHPPCMSPKCCRSFECMDQITVDQVYKAAENYLKVGSDPTLKYI